MTEPARKDPGETPKALSVAEFNRVVKDLLEEHFAAVWIEGEITGLKISSVGHAYFDLKDDRESARVSCCLFKGQLARARTQIKDGERVLVRARASIYPARGQFQLIIETVLPTGAGLAAAALEALKKKLAAEGLFAAERKRRLPKFPRAIGVVTAERSAAFADICRVAHRRWPIRIIVANTLVQGADAPVGIVAALEAIQHDPRIDVVIVGRGGGASDDLAAFNDERVARAIAACRVPVIAAIGHEIDHTLADLVADVRASTPSNAAELAVPEIAVVLEDIETHGKRLRHAIRARIDARRVVLARFEKRFTDPRRLTETTRQRLDEDLRRLETVLRKRLADANKRFADARAKIDREHPRARLLRDRGVLNGLNQRLAPATRSMLGAKSSHIALCAARLTPAVRQRDTRARGALAELAARLDALSPLGIFSRGYSVVIADARATSSVAELRVGQHVDVKMRHGAFRATIGSIDATDWLSAQERAPFAESNDEAAPAKKSANEKRKRGSS